MPLRRGRRAYGVVVTGIIGLGVLVPTTRAAATTQVLYVAPDGGGSDCTKSAPCELVTTVATAPSGSDVVLSPGSYGTAQNPITETVSNGVDGSTYRSITVEGTPGKAPPTIFTSSDYGVILVNSFVRRVTIEHSGAVGGVELYNTIASLVRVDSDGADWACEVDNSSLIDAVCHSTTSAGDAVRVQALGGATINSDVTNVTAIAEGASSAAVECNALSSSAATIQLNNTLALGHNDGVSADASTHSAATVTGSNDLFSGSASSTAGGSTADVDIDNQIVGKPVLVDVANGDYHERAASATVNAGLPKGGSFDLDGLPRKLGKAVDVGAYEFAPAAKLHKVHITHSAKHSVTVSAVVATAGLPAVVTLVAKHGSTKISSHHHATNGTTKELKLTVKHLKAHTQYALQIVVNDAGGTTKKSAGHK